MIAKRISQEAGEEAIKVEASELVTLNEKQPRLKARWIIETEKSGWKDNAISEWELKAAGFEDLHPHDEITFVLEGEIHITVDGVEYTGTTGDMIKVPADKVGTYWAPVYARMLAIYGPNPEGKTSEYLRYWEIDK